MIQRPLVAAAAVLLLGGVAAWRAPLAYLPSRSFPELEVRLALAEATDPELVTRQWVVPIESRIRSLGAVRAVTGTVGSSSAWLTVGFEPGTDPEAKAARLDAELVSLRRQLPQGAEVAVEPAADRQGDLHALVWLRGSTADEEAERAAAELRRVVGVREVEVYGRHRLELGAEVRGDPLAADAVAARIEDTARRAVVSHRLGDLEAGRQVWAVAVPATADLGRVPVPAGDGALPLASLADLSVRRRPPLVAARRNGAPARALFVRREREASPLAVDRDLRRAIAGSAGPVRPEIAWSEADDLRRLLLRIGAGVAAASLAGTLVVGWMGGGLAALFAGLAPPVLAAGALNALWLTGVPLDATTLVGALLGIALALPYAFRRLVGPRIGAGAAGMVVTAALCATVPAIGVALAGRELGPLLRAPARSFLVAAWTALALARLLPALGRPGRRSVPFRGQRTALRDPGTAWLLGATVAVAIVVGRGEAWLPRPGTLASDDGSLTVTLRLPEGTTQEVTADHVAEVERQLDEAEGVVGHWAVLRAGLARVTADLDAAARRPERRRRLVTTLRYAVRSGASLLFASGRPTDVDRGRAGAAKARLGDDLASYTMVLRSADLRALRSAYERVGVRLASLRIRPGRITGWGTPSVRTVLEPVPGTSPELAASVAAHLRRQSEMPRSVPLPGPVDRRFAVYRPGTPRREGEVPQRADLLARPLAGAGGPVVPAALLVSREEAVHESVGREDGRFVVPIEVRMPSVSEAFRRKAAAELDASLAGLPLPVGVDLERPILDPLVWEPERLRMLALAVVVPLLLFAIAAGRTGSLGWPVVALAAPVGGLLLATPGIAATLERIDELSLFAAGAAACAILAVAVEVTSGLLEGRPGPGALYRRLRHESAWLVGAGIAATVLLALPTVGLDGGLAKWATPLRLAGVAGAGGTLVTLLLVPGAVLSLVGFRRDAEARRRARHPPAWSAPGAPHVAVRHLVKVYRNGFEALSGFDLELGPGIVGLLGPNGAGKTTMLRLLTGLLEPTRGSIRYRGIEIGPENLAAYRLRVGYLPQELDAYPGFTAEQFLDYWALERGIGPAAARRAEVEELLEAVGLTEHADRRVRELSGGMRRRVGIARALLGRPPVLVVDEPTTGLDAESRHAFRRTLLGVAGHRIILFSTHIAGDVEALARRILLLHRGRLLFDGPPDELVARARSQVFETVVDDAELVEVAHRYRVTSRVRGVDGVRVRVVVGPDGDPPAGPAVTPSLEEAYLVALDRVERDRRGVVSRERFAFLREGVGEP